MKNSTTTGGEESKHVPSHSAYTFDELRELWYISMLHGATLWQYCQDTGKELPKDFERGLDLLREEVEEVNSIKFLLSNRFALVGLFDELLAAHTHNSTVKDDKKI